MNLNDSAPSIEVVSDNLKNKPDEDYDDIPSHLTRKISRSSMIKMVMPFLISLVTLVIGFELNRFFFQQKEMILINNPTYTFDGKLQGVYKPEKLLLVGIMSPYHAIEKRSVIRTMMIEKYKEYNVTFKFCVGRTPNHYLPVLEHENEMYQDLIFVPEVVDTREFATHIKPTYFFRYVEENYPIYSYVAKMDDDAYINIPMFLNDFLTKYQEQPYRLVFGRPIPLDGYVGTAGQFMVLSWDIVMIFNQMQRKEMVSDVMEDVLPTYLMNKAKIPINLVVFPNEIAFDFLNINTTIDDGVHKVTKETLCPHQLKDTDTFLKVASLFDEKGVILSALNDQKNF